MDADTHYQKNITDLSTSPHIVGSSYHMNAHFQGL